MNKEIEVDAGAEYAFVISNENVVGSNPDFSLKLMQDSPNHIHKGKSITLCAWDETVENFLTGAPDRVEVCKVKITASEG